MMTTMLRPAPPPGSPVVVVVGGPGPTTNAVFHRLTTALGEVAQVVTVLEERVPRRGLARRRARRLGWATTAGQVAFVVVALPFLRRSGRRRIAVIADRAGLHLEDPGVDHRVSSVNDGSTIDLLARLDPTVVVIHGTRILTPAVLHALAPVPVVNLHAGVTPRYRGVHGGYWALAEGRPDLAGVTVHLVDPGIDTGAILGQASFVAERGDSIATYPYAQLACGLPLLESQVLSLIGGKDPVAVPPMPGAETSVLRWHPTLWGYLWRWTRSGVT